MDTKALHRLVDALARWAEEGRTVAAMSIDAGIPAWRVRMALLGLELRKRGKRGRPKRRQKFKDGDIQEIIKTYQSGMGLVKLAQAYSVGIPCIREVLVSAGVSIHPRGNARKRTPDGRNDAICSAYLAGKTMEEISRSYQMTRERVRQILLKGGVKRRHYGKTTVSVPISTLAEQAKSMSLDQMASEHKTTKGAIRAAMRKAGLRRMRSAPIRYPYDEVMKVLARTRSRAEAAKILGCSLITVGRIARRQRRIDSGPGREQVELGLPGKRRGRPRGPRPPIDVLSEQVKTMSIEQMASHHGCNKYIIRKALYEAGIQPRGAARVMGGQNVSKLPAENVVIKCSQG